MGGGAASTHGPNPTPVFEQNGRKGTHITNCSGASPTGYLTQNYNQVHHILCHSCVQDSAIFVTGTDKTYIKKCIAMTDWDVNNTKNIIGLPLKNAYPPDADGGKYSEHAKWDKLPCHQHDHNPYYTQAVKTWLHDKIWSTLKGKVNNCDVSPKSVAGLLDDSSKHWQDFLVDRGKEHDGTKYCWDERNKSKKAHWYKPFSMWPGGLATIPKRSAPPDGFKWNKKMSDIMQKIK